MKTLPSLESLLSYELPSVLSRYQKDYPDNQLSPSEAWADLMRFFWLSQRHLQEKKQNPNDESLNFECGMFSAMEEMDDMWHTFLLFTREYAEFSDRFFGTFLHHSPATEEIPLEKREASFEKYLSYIYDHLGEETLRRWFQFDE